jgi:hypothetical protein
MLAWADEEDDTFYHPTPIRPRAQSYTSPKRERATSFSRRQKSSGGGSKSSLKWEKLGEKALVEQRVVENKGNGDEVTEDKHATIKASRSPSASPTKHRPPRLDKLAVNSETQEVSATRRDEPDNSLSPSRKPKRIPSLSLAKS